MFRRAGPGEVLSVNSGLHMTVTGMSMCCYFSLLRALRGVGLAFVFALYFELENNPIQALNWLLQCSFTWFPQESLQFCPPFLNKGSAKRLKSRFWIWAGHLKSTRLRQSHADLGQEVLPSVEGYVPSAWPLFAKPLLTSRQGKVLQWK